MHVLNNRNIVQFTPVISFIFRFCNGVSGLEDVNVATDQDKELKRLKTEMTSIKERLEDAEQKSQTYIESVETQRKEVISDVEKLEQSLVQHIQKLKHEALETLEKEYTLIKENLETNISQIRKVNLEIEQERNQLPTVNNLDQIQQFVHTKLVQQTANVAMDIIKQSDVKVCPDLPFTENKDLKLSIMTSTTIGHIQNVTESNNLLSPKVYKVRSKKEINLKLSNDKKVCNGSAICRLLDGTIILADWNNKKIKRLDVSYNVRDYLDVGDNPTGICCTGNTEVAVKLRSDKVKFISVGSSFSELKEFSVTGGAYWGISFCAGELWSSTGSGVDVYSMSGTLLKTISKDVNRQNIFTLTPEQMVVIGDTVIITDNGDGAVFLRRDGTAIKQLRDTRLTTTKSVCVSSEGTVFIAGYDSHNIVMFDKNGKSLGELIGKDDAIKSPTCICFDKKRNCLLVFSEYSKILVALNVID